MALSVIISREAGDLTLPGSAPAEGLWVESLTRPRQAWRRTRVSSDWLHGSPATSQVLETTELQMVVHARVDDPADLAALRSEFLASVYQWSFTLTATEDGVTDVYSCDPADVDPNPYHSGRAAAGVASFSLTIPCHPIPGA